MTTVSNPSTRDPDVEYADNAWTCLFTGLVVCAILLLIVYLIDTGTFG